MKRFYKEVTVQSCDGGWQVMLDTRPIRTQGGAKSARAQIVRSQTLAEMLAEEWRAQGDEIDTNKFVFRDMADFALDMAGDMADNTGRENAIANLLKFSGTDTLCYRYDREDPLFQPQADLWDPLVTACEQRHGLNFARGSGVMPIAQDAAVTQRLQEILSAHDNFALAGLQTLASLAASLIIGLAALEEGVDAEQLFAASNAEEDFQAEKWGWEEDAEKVRALRLTAFIKAHDFVKAARA